MSAPLEKRPLKNQKRPQGSGSAHVENHWCIGIEYDN